MTRLIYFSRDYTTHDHRFLSALADTQYEVYYLRLERRHSQLEDRPIPQKVKQINWYGGNKIARLRVGPRLLFSLRKVIREVEPDLIHAGPIQSCALLVALLRFRPLISMSWGYDLLQDADRNGMWRKATEYTLRFSNLLITDCETVSRKANLLGMPLSKMVTFPWGVDLTKFTPGDYPPGEEKQFTLISTRAWEPIYGVDILAKAFVKAADQLPQLKLIMLGNGSQSGYLHEMFNRAGLMDRVSLPGQVRQVDLPQYYHMADIYVSASHIDGSSVSLMEALACGRPVLVSDIPGNREWVEPGIHGWWFKDGEVDVLAETIIKAVNQPQKLSNMSREARKLAEERADWKENFPLLLEAYEAALGHH